MGFYDVHYTHSNVEFGRDFIAKRIEEDEEIQYSFQSKAGVIDHGTWRNEVHGQLWEAAFTPLAHPAFDGRLPHQAVLVATGRLSGNASIAFGQMNQTIENVYHLRPVILWGQQLLIESLLKYNITSMHQSSTQSLSATARFFVLYSHCLEGRLSDRDLEEYSRWWIDVDLVVEQRMLWGSVEAEVLSQLCIQHGRIYEALQIHLAQSRVLMALYYREKSDHLVELFREQQKRIRISCKDYLNQFEAIWLQERDIIRSVRDPILITTYPVQCARVLEVSGLYYFSTDDEREKISIASFVEDFILREDGACHPISDRYAVSLVVAVLVLLDQLKCDAARYLLRRATFWLCDRYEKGIGLAGLEANEAEETRMTAGYCFDLSDVAVRRDSFLATALCDLAAFIGDVEFYQAVVNDVKACEVVCEYFQCDDSEGACRIESEDVITYPSLNYRDEFSSFDAFDFADHMPHEPARFTFADAFGLASVPMLMCLLRDRYFPKLWPSLVSQERGT
jgi:hypothetical protein